MSFPDKIIDVLITEVIEGIFFSVLLIFLNKFAFSDSLKNLSKIIIIIWIIVGIITIIVIVSEIIKIER